MSWEIDHLVVGAADLVQGAAWCRETLGIEPSPGGVHRWMGTHNLLASIGSDRFPRSYLEIIAVDPDAPPPQRRRWFDLDAEPVRAALARRPALLHWVARCSDIDAACRSLADAGIDRGEVLTAERASSQGLLRWRISVRTDGQRLHGGALPTLIEWAGVHPASALPERGLRLERLIVGVLPAIVQPHLPCGVACAGNTAAAPLRAVFATPLGPVELSCDIAS